MWQCGEVSQGLTHVYNFFRGFQTCVKQAEVKTLKKEELKKKNKHDSYKIAPALTTQCNGSHGNACDNEKRY